MLFEFGVYDVCVRGIGLRREVFIDKCICFDKFICSSVRRIFLEILFMEVVSIFFFL